MFYRVRETHRNLQGTVRFTHPTDYSRNTRTGPPHVETDRIFMCWVFISWGGS